MNVGLANELMRELSGINRLTPAWECFMHFAKKLGFSEGIYQIHAYPHYGFFGEALDLGLTGEKPPNTDRVDRENASVIESTYSLEFMEHYIKRRWIESDETIPAIRDKREVYRWKSLDEIESMHRRRECDLHAVEQSKYLSQNGMESGISIPLDFDVVPVTNGKAPQEKIPLTVYGSGIGLCIRNMSRKEFGEFPDDLIQCARDLSWVFHYHVRDAVNLSDRLIAPLTEQERDYLTVAAHGLSRKEMCEILGLRTGQLDAIQKRVKRKLNARTKSHAIARALSLRLIPRALYATDYRATPKQLAMLKLSCLGFNRAQSSQLLGYGSDEATKELRNTIFKNLNGARSMTHAVASAVSCGQLY